MAISKTAEEGERGQRKRVTEGRGSSKSFQPLASAAGTLYYFLTDVALISNSPHPKVDDRTLGTIK